MKFAAILPTLGEREHLFESLESLMSQDFCQILIVCPTYNNLQIPQDSRIKLLQDSGSGLASSLNLALQYLDPDIDYFCWLNDDDVLMPDALDTWEEMVQDSPACAFGACDYVSPSGETLWTSRFGMLAARLVGIGPDLVPQPSACFHLKFTNKIGGMRVDRGLAFDYDYKIRLKREGAFKSTTATLSRFMWHKGSLTVSNRFASALSASSARVKTKSGTAKLLQVVCEPLIVFLTWLAGKILTMRALVPNSKNRKASH